MHRAPTQEAISDSTLVESLLDPGAFDHAAEHPELVETHISWLILAGNYVYKIKKPLVLDFLDFGTLDKRHFYCEEEVRLNQPWAPSVYLDVVPVTRRGDHYRFGGPGIAVEYAVRMRRFEQDLRLDRQLELGLLTVADMKELAGNIASRHAAAERIDEGQRDRVLNVTGEFMRDNFDALAGSIDDALLSHLRDWTEAELINARDLLAARFDNGFVRDCHGDLHLGNLVRLDDGITTFDCIEFNTDLRHIDTMCDIAFLVMDLVQRQRTDLASHFLNRYLEASGDYDGVPLLNLFFVYRCLVRAKVAVIRAGERDEASEAAADMAEAQAYCEMARVQSANRQPVLIVMHGLSGSGKTWVAGQLMAALPAVRIRSDIERKRLFGLDESADSHSGIGQGLYSEAANAAVYERLLELTRALLGSGHNVILDAAFLDEKDRVAASQVAAALTAPVVIVDVQASDAAIERRLSSRAAEGRDASEAGLAVLERQRQTGHPLSPQERKSVIACDNSVSIDVDEVVSRIKARVKEQHGIPLR